MGIGKVLNRVVSAFTTKRQPRQYSEDDRSGLFPDGRRSQVEALRPDGEDPFKQVREYRSWPFAATNAIAFRLAGIPLNLYRRLEPDKATGKPAEEQVFDHPALDLMRKANARDTGFDLLAEALSFLVTTGNSYILKQSGGATAPGMPPGAPTSLWNLPAQYVTVIPDPHTIVGGYRYRREEKDFTFELDDIIHLRYPNVQSLYYGKGPVQAAEWSVDLTQKIYRMQDGTFKNAQFPGFVFKTKDPRMSMDDKNLKRFFEKLKAHYGKPESARKPFVCPGFIEIVKTDWTKVELDYTGSGHQMRDDTLGVLGTPAAVLGLTANLNRSTAWAMENIFSRFTLDPLGSGMVVQRLNEDLLPAFGDPDLFFRYDDIVPNDLEAIRKNWELALKNGAPLNRYLLAIGEAPVEGGDVGHIPSGAVPLDEEPPPAAPTDPPADETPDEPPPVEPGDGGAERRVRIYTHVVKDLDASARAIIQKETAAARAVMQRQMVSEIAAQAKDEKRLVIATLRGVLATNAGMGTVGASHKAEMDVAAQVVGQIKWEEQAKELSDATVETLGKSLLLGGELEGGLQGVGILFTLENPQVSEWLRTKGPEYWLRGTDDASGAIATRIAKVQNALADGLVQGEGLRDLSARVRELYDEEIAGYQAERIARTEVLSASGQGGQQQRREAEMPFKTWMTDLDERTRDGTDGPANHVILDGVTVANEATFPNGLLYPGDPSGAAGEIINCRCTAGGALQVEGPK